MKSRTMLLAASMACPLFAGCQSGPRAVDGTIIGGALGAFTGAVIGSASGHPRNGALLGAVAGGLAGNVIGDAQDARDERDAAAAYADAVAYDRMVESQMVATALTNSDVIKMAQNGVGDDVIVNAIRTRGGAFDCSPDAILILKQYGVSDHVIRYMQDAPVRAPLRTASYRPRRVYVAPAPVVVAPPPRVIVAPRRYGWYYHHGW